MTCRKYFLAFYLVLGFMVVNGQDSPEFIRQLWTEGELRDFDKLRTEVEDFYEDRDKGKGSGYKQWKRYEYYMATRLDNAGRLTNVAARNWQGASDYYNQKSAVSHTGDWSFVTPSSWTNGQSGYNPGIGRVNAVAFHPTDPQTLYIGTPLGGIWKSTDQGNNWIPLHDGLPSLGVSSIVVHPSNPDTLFILTGDGDGGSSQGVGVLKSYDGGTTWSATGLSWNVDNLVRGYKLLMDPANHSVMFAAATNGIWRTSDGGVTWNQQATGSFRDIEIKPGDSNVLFAEKGGDFYRSSDGGLTWSQITSGTPTGASRLAIGISPDDPDNVYVLAGPSTGVGVFKGLYQSTDSGLNFSLLSNVPNILGYSSSGSDNSNQAWYDLAIAVHPLDDSLVYTGGINIWKTELPAPFTNITQWVFGGTQYTHADIHALEYNPLNNYLYCGSDGGIFQSTDGGDIWTDLSQGLPIMQFYKIAGTESDSQLLVGGTQDNGTNKWSGGTSVTHIFGADGMDCMIDHSNSDIIYYSYQQGGLRKSVDGGATAINIAPASGSWVTPYLMDPNNSMIIYGGYSDVYKSTNGGSTWSNMGADGRGAMAIGTNDSNRLYAAINSTLRTSPDGGSSWTVITGPWGTQHVTGITVNPDNANEVFVTVSGYTAGSKVFSSADAGVTWANLSGTLPNVPHNCIVFEDTNGTPADALYVGTDIGVFYRDNDLGDWIPFTNGLPTVEVSDLEISYSAAKIRAATFGRGIWESDLYSTCPPSYILTTANNPGATDESVGLRFYQASDFIESSRIIGGGIGTSVLYRAANYIELKDGFRTVPGVDFEVQIGPCGTY